MGVEDGWEESGEEYGSLVGGVGRWRGLVALVGGVGWWRMLREEPGGRQSVAGGY